MPRDQLVVLGAGPAGLGAGLALGDEAIILEQAHDVGGLSSTIELGGAIFDLGGHSFHTPHASIRDLVFAALPMEEQPRQAWCFFRGEWIPYPFQKYAHCLADHVVREECLAAPGAAEGGRHARNFDDYLEQRFGTGITRHFLRPYNQKLWGKDLKRLTAEWTPERIPGPLGVAEGLEMVGGRRTPLQDNSTIAYPARGGFGEIFRTLAGRLPRLQLGRRVVHINPLRRELQMADGETIGWRQIISTLPLSRLLRLLPAVPPAIVAAVGQLEVIPLSLVMVAVEGRLDTPRQRIYCPGAEIPAHKIVLNHNSSTYLRALPHHGILAEVAGLRSEPDDELLRKVILGLRTLGFASALKHIRQTRIVHLPFGYPVPTHDRATIVAQVRNWLAEHGIHTVGRFGEWAYINSDEALYRGLSLGAQLAKAA